jgi:serine/threonine-protein kinase
MDIGTHPALRTFHILQELSPERGNKTYLARQRSGNLVAIKVLASREISEEESSLLSKEASLGARLGHDAILQSRALIVEKDFAAVVTEFVPGVSLQRLLRFAASRGVRLPDVCSYWILERVLAGLASAHATSGGPVLHRGVSASSVVVGWDGTVKLGDFGLVRMRQIVSGGQMAKSERDVAPIMSPEEARGDRPDARSDVFCTALLAVRLATGRTPYARFRSSASEMILAMAEGNVARLARTRPDMPAELRDAIDAALEPDREKRTMTAEKMLAVVRAHVVPEQGKAALAKLLERWRQPLEASVTPWERRASIPDDVPEDAADSPKAGTLMLAMPDERPSDPALVSGDAPPDEPWKKDDAAVATEETALAPTKPDESVSRIGLIASDALVMPLPAMRITIPELPTYGGPPVNIPRPPPKQGGLTGARAAALVGAMFVVLVTGAIVLFRWLLGPR